MRITILPVFIITLFLSATALAGMSVLHKHEEEDAQKSAFDAVMMKMHEEMGKAETTGNVDVDFVLGMIPHHQGAVDMAEIEMRQGKDPAIKKLAAEIIKSQRTEIDMMKKWLAAHPAK